jgi:hypothetical protein
MDAKRSRELLRQLSKTDNPYVDVCPAELADLLDAAEKLHDTEIDLLEWRDEAYTQKRMRTAAESAAQRLRDALAKMARHPVDLVAEIAKQALEVCE